MSIDEDVVTPLAQRIQVPYPTWLRGVCVAIFVLQALKVPSLNKWALAKASNEPGLSDGISADLFRSSIYAGVGVVLLFSSVVGCVVLYSTAKMLHRNASVGQAAFSGPSGGVLRSLAFALVWPDAWAATGIIQPLVSPLYWITHIAILTFIARLSAHERSLSKQLGACLGISLLGVLL